MFKIFGIVAAAVAVMIAAVLVLAATKPDTFRVARSTTIIAPPYKIFPLIHDLHKFNTWNPYEKKDPNIQGTYSGPVSGKGAAYSWESREVGRGSMEITDTAASSRVTMKLDFVKPFEAHNIVEFALAPNGDATEVTWAMNGPVPFIAKIVHVFIDMDKMVGTDFEAGLANLKAVAEK